MKFQRLECSYYKRKIKNNKMQSLSQKIRQTTIKYIKRKYKGAISEENNNNKEKPKNRRQDK